MKRFAKVFVSAILLVVTAFTFAACVPSSYDKAASKMQDAVTPLSDPLTIKRTPVR